MNETLLHRGPDSDGSVIDGPCGLAMRRLSIIDLAGGDQPIGNEDGRIQVVQNGEIYNYRELRDELRGRGHTFTHPQRHRGAGPPLRGARAGVRRGAARDVRDRDLGLPDTAGCCSPATASASSPSTTASPGAQLSFASELKALLRQPGFSREIDPQALEAFLAFNSIPAPLTIFKRGAQAARRPHAGGREGGGRESRRYARPAPVPADRGARARATRRSPRSCASGCGIRSGPTWSRTSRSACCSRAASTPPP